MSSGENELRFEAALASDDPAAKLWKLAVDLRDAGMSQVDLFLLFSKYQIETPGDDPRYDAIVDSMDLIYGGPWAKGGDLYPDQLTETAIEAARRERESNEASRM